MHQIKRYFLIFGTFIAYALGFYTIYLFMKACFEKQVYLKVAAVTAGAIALLVLIVTGIRIALT